MTSFYNIQGWGWRLPRPGILPPPPPPPPAPPPIPSTNSMYTVMYHPLHFPDRSEINMQEVFHSDHCSVSNLGSHSVTSCYKIEGWGILPRATPTINKVMYYLLHSSARSEIYMQAVFHSDYYKILLAFFKFLLSASILWPPVKTFRGGVKISCPHP